MSTITKRLPYELWEIDAVEGWLDDMAGRGMIFTHYSGGQFYFREEEPQALRHRLDLHEASINHDRRHEEFLDFGWEHICYLNSRTDIYRAAREDAVELNTDEGTLRNAMERSQRRIRNTMYLCWGGSAYLLIFAAISLCRFGFFHIPTTKDFRDLFKLLLWGMLIAAGDLRLWRSYRDIKSRSLLERTYHSQEQETVRRREQRLRTVICLVLLVMSATSLFDGDYSTGERMEIADTGYERYSVREILFQESALDNGVAMYYPHNLSEEYNFLQDTVSGNDYYVKIHEANGAWLARAYAREQARIADAETLTVAGHEGAWFYVGTPISRRHYLDSPDTQNLILLKGNIVVEIEYTGSADLNAAALAIRKGS